MASGPLVLCVDAGRSSVKVAGDRGFSHQFLSAVSQVDTSFLKDFQWIKANRLLSVNGQYYACGDAALAHSQNPTYVNSDELFIENIGLFVRESIVSFDAYLGASTSADAPMRLVLAIDLTYNSMRYKGRIKQLLSPIHTVTVSYRGKTYQVHVVIEDILFFYQGWSGMMSLLVDEDLNTVSGRGDMTRGNGVVIDIGRSTTDITRINKLTPVSGESYRFGTIAVYEQIQRILRDRYGMGRKLLEVEQAVHNDSPIRTIKGDSVSLGELYPEAVKQCGKEFRSIILEHVGDQALDYAVVLGGGGKVFYDLISEEFALVELVADYTHANAQGMWRFIRRYKVREE